MKVSVSKKRWGRGMTGGSLLGTTQRNKGKMCCLGFACRQLGIRASVMAGVGYPVTLFHRALTARERTVLRQSPLLGGCYGTTMDSSLARRAALINDNAVLTDAARMTQLRALFKRHGHQIVFVP